MIADARTFGRLVRQHRNALGLTQRELATAINTGERFIVDLEAGKPTCRLGSALAAARAVGMKLVDASEAGEGQEVPADAPDLPGRTA